MSQDDKPLSGEVEADETFVDGKIRNLERRKRDALGWDPKKWAAARKTVVYGAVERKGRVKATGIPNKSSRVPVRDAAVEAAGSAAPG